MSESAAPAAPKPKAEQTGGADPIAEQRTASEVAGNAAGQDVDAPADAKGGEEGGSGHDPMAGAAVMHVHQEKHGYNILTPATDEDDPKIEMMKEAAGPEGDQGKESVSEKIKEGITHAAHKVEGAIPGTKEHEARA